MNRCERGSWPKRKRNPNGFSIDEARTAQNIVDEGGVLCVKVKRWMYPRIEIRMCDREALEPTQRVFGTKITRSPHRKKRLCPPQLYPPDGRGIWRVGVTGGKAKQIVQRLSPLLTKEFLRKWQEHLKKCP